MTRTPVIVLPRKEIAMVTTPMLGTFETLLVICTVYAALFLAHRAS